MNTKKFDATVANIGEWQGKEDEAIHVWNTIVSPTLRKYEEEIGEDRIHYVQHEAYEAFCNFYDLSVMPQDLTRNAEKAVEIIEKWI